MDGLKKDPPCKDCNDASDDPELEEEFEHFRQHLADRDAYIVALEGEFVKCNSRTKNLEEQIDTWREKYERLYDSHKRVQKLNQVLEEKLLQMVDKMKGEKSQLTKDIATLSVRLAESKHNYSMLQKENERYKNDMNLAIQLLQCKPDNFVSQKLDNLPVDTQARVSQYVMSKTPKSTNTNNNQSKSSTELDAFDTSEYEFNISASLMSKILEDSIQDTVTKHCDTCTCNKTQNKPFCYNESYYSVGTQTLFNGDMKNSLCSNCNSDIKSTSGQMNKRCSSPHTVRLINEKLPINQVSPMYIVPQPLMLESIQSKEFSTNNISSYKEKLIKITNYDENKPHSYSNDNAFLDEKLVKVTDYSKDSIPKIGVKPINNCDMTMEPEVHHKLCDRTKTSISSHKSSIRSNLHDEGLIKDLSKDAKIKTDDVLIEETKSLRKSSLSSMGAVSRTSSAAKSTVSGNKSNTAVGPGPRFCHLRMQAGSKNILLDNAQPDVPPVLYRRQSRCDENAIFNSLTGEFVGPENTNNVSKKDDAVVETTLIDVQVDNNVKETTTLLKNNTINPILMNVSSSPLQPLKTHTFSNKSDKQQSNELSIASHNTCQTQNNMFEELEGNCDALNIETTAEPIVNKLENDISQVASPKQNNDIKLFNFDQYEQTNPSSQYSKSIKKIDMAQLHCLENTKISVDLPTEISLLSCDKTMDLASKILPAIVNVYPNINQTRLKSSDNKGFTNEQSSSSHSSDDSASILQKQQLLRVAEWVEQNLEQQNHFQDPIEDDVAFSNKATRDAKLASLSEALNEIALSMPHPVSKYSKTYQRELRHNNLVQHLKSMKVMKHSASDPKVSNNVTKETIFPIHCGDVVTESKVAMMTNDISSKDEINMNGSKEITPEELARMEYNVKKFLLSGPQWVDPENRRKDRNTSSKTETDV